MAYVLGIDIGGTCTSAAVSRLVGPTWGRPEIVRLDGQSSAVPSVLHVAANGSFTVGDPARDGLLVDGGRVARGFVGRIGDDVPMVVAGEACKPQTLAAVLAMWVVERVLAQEGAHPEHIVLTHPAGWGQYRKRLLHEALWEIGLTNVTLLPRPVTAAECHSFQGFNGRTLAVYALGGTSFEMSVVRRAQPAGFQVLGSAAGVEPLGGVDFDEALVDHVRAAIAHQIGAGQLGDPRVRLALSGLPVECSRAKETLTVATETDVRVHLPQGPVEVHLTRAEFEELIRPALELTVDTLDRTIRLVGLRAEQLDGILLVGGSARIPLVTELVTARFPGAAEVTAEADPQVTVATGAALAACQILALASRRHDPNWRRQPAPIEYPDGGPPSLPQERADDGEDDHREPPPRPPVTVTPLDLPRPRSTSRLVPGRGFRAFGLVIAPVVIGMMATMSFDTPTSARMSGAREYGAPVGSASAVILATAPTPTVTAPSASTPPAPTPTAPTRSSGL
ncbi:Hsp70 family protein [Planosporangium sp. 12N6]|uniref:Hsp70 family protein n=1 Tax=Planosporangium spinosum TaxID=3402278 RepID=UPI003CEDA135